jgi:hypothetical protein
VVRKAEEGHRHGYRKPTYRVGGRVRVREHHRITARRSMVGTIVGCYGGEKHVAIDVILSDGERRLFWPRDLEEISPRSPCAWWCS